MELYNLEYRILDRLGRTKKTLWGGLFATQEALVDKQNEVLNKHKKVGSNWPALVQTLKCHD